MKQEYIEWLQAHEARPRPRIEDLEALAVPPGLPQMSMADVSAADGQCGRDLYVTLNGKVLKSDEGSGAAPGETDGETSEVEPDTEVKAKERQDKAAKAKSAKADEGTCAKALNEPDNAGGSCEGCSS